ncbi:MAG TPA: hypothetical protein EYN70_00515, partial [Planctomycetaceae bacterium]|nr:hypothetical protein [Planctomycetaceae bacterium]
ATDITGQGRDSGTLQASRQALLDFLVDALNTDLLERTVIVFDAHDPPPGLPRQVQQGGLQIHFAAGFPSADELLEHYIAAHTAPRQLLVVSSDHRVQRAAHRRRATSVDSDTWYRKLLANSNRSRDHDNRLANDKPVVPPSAAEVQRWLQEFAPAAEEILSSNDSPHQGTDSDPTQSDAEDDGNPFPPGYGEDLLAEDEPDKKDGFSLD